MSVGFEWDPRKASANLRKHDVSFDEAATAFNDPLARIFGDPNHSLNERREIIVGHSIKERLLLVCFSERHSKISNYERPTSNQERTKRL